MRCLFVSLLIGCAALSGCSDNEPKAINFSPGPIADEDTPEEMNDVQPEER